jgi:hypothetical protein
LGISKQSHFKAANGGVQIGRLVAAAAAKAADQESYAESHSGCCIWTLLDRCTKKIISLAGTVANGFRGTGGCVFGLTVKILHGPFHLLCLAMELAFHVSGSPPISFLDLTAKVFGGTGQPIFIRESILHNCKSSGRHLGTVP